MVSDIEDQAEVRAVAQTSGNVSVDFRILNRPVSTTGLAVRKHASQIWLQRSATELYHG